MSVAPGQLPSLDVVFELAKRTLDSQNAAVDSLDAKIGAVFGAASLIMSLTAFAKLPSIAPFDYKSFLFVLAGLAYLVSVAYCGLAYRATGILVMHNPSVLLEHYAPLPPEKAIFQLVSYMGEDFSHNQDVLHHKATLLNYALVGAGAEISLLLLRVLLGP